MSILDNKQGGSARHDTFLNSPMAQEHNRIRDEIITELHLEFETRHRIVSSPDVTQEEIHAVCAMCRRSIAPLMERHTGHETSKAYTLDALATLYMHHFMHMHYEQEGRHDA